MNITRGIPQFNIQIGPVDDALSGGSPDLVLSFSDSFSSQLAAHPGFHWIPVNETARTWGYSPFFASKKLLDRYCVELSFTYVGCRNGNHRSPLMAFCWLLSQQGATLEGVANEFYSEGGHFSDLCSVYHGHVMTQQIPPDLPLFYEVMNAQPEWSYGAILKALGKSERIVY